MIYTTIYIYIYNRIKKIITILIKHWMHTTLTYGARNKQRTIEIEYIYIYIWANATVLIDSWQTPLLGFSLLTWLTTKLLICHSDQLPRCTRARPTDSRAPSTSCNCISASLAASVVSPLAPPFYKLI